ncbi:MAG TPA: hypothetical protein VKY22_02520 [Bradyrhizobium sp.]|nr:hypothetical protein [Bradyrhizobium sp.]
MITDRLSEEDVDAAQDHLDMLRTNGLVPTKHHILRNMINAAGASATAMNINVAQGTYFRGMKLALDRCWPSRILQARRTRMAIRSNRR